MSGDGREKHAMRDIKKDQIEALYQRLQALDYEAAAAW
jgi:hypothetical protein